MTATARATPFALPLARPLRVAGGVVAARFGALVDAGGGLGEAIVPPGAAPPDRIPVAVMRAALGCAALDAEARAAGVPLAALLGGVRRRRIALNALLSAPEPAAAAVEAAAWVGRGFRCLKLKLAPDDRDGDRRRLAAVRARVGPTVALRVDANAAWSVDHAIAALRDLAEFDLEYAEQPATGIAELAAVRRAVPVAIAADEAVVDADSADRVIAAGAADVIVIKPAWLGLRQSVDVARRARAAGLAVTVTSALDSSVGIAAAAQVAAAIEGPLRACGLATAELLAGDLVSEPLPIVDGVLLLSDAPGLGVSIDHHALARFQIGTAYEVAATEKTVGRGFRLARPHEVRSWPCDAGQSGAEAPLHAIHSAPSLLADRAARYGDRVALADATRALTFAALRVRAGAVAAQLDAAKVRRGHRVGLLLGDRLTLAIWLHGIAHRGAVAVPLGERLTAAELAQQLGASPCRALVTDGATATQARELPRSLAGPILVADDLPDRDGPVAPFDAAAPHSIIFTSGSSGRPKPIPLQ